MDRFGVAALSSGIRPPEATRLRFGFSRMGNGLAPEKFRDKLRDLPWFLLANGMPGICNGLECALS
jgi:hypothetical protein